MAAKVPKPKCPFCGGQLRYRVKTQDYVCMSNPHIIPLSEMTPLQPLAKDPITPVTHATD